MEPSSHRAKTDDIHATSTATSTTKCTAAQFHGLFCPALEITRAYLLFPGMD
jgi:hypothetical protein